MARTTLRLRVSLSLSVSVFCVPRCHSRTMEQRRNQRALVFVFRFPGQRASLGPTLGDRDGRGGAGEGVRARLLAVPVAARAGGGGGRGNADRDGCRLGPAGASGRGPGKAYSAPGSGLRAGWGIRVSNLNSPSLPLRLPGAAPSPFAPSLSMNTGASAQCAPGAHPPWHTH